LSVCRELFVANIERVDLTARHGQCQTAMCTYILLLLQYIKIYEYMCTNALNIEK